MSSRSILPARSDRFFKNSSRRPSDAPFNASGSLSFSTARNSPCMAAEDSRDRSSKVNISALILSADSRLRSSSAATKRALAGAVQVVEDLGHHLVRVTPGRTGQVGHELGPQGTLDAVQHVLLHALHPEHPHDDLDGEALRQQGQHAGGMIRSHLGQHDGDRLRVFVLQVVRQHRLVHVAELVPHGAAGRPADLLHDLRHAVPRQGALQQPLGAFEAADEVAHARPCSRRTRRRAAPPSPPGCCPAAPWRRRPP